MSPTLVIESSKPHQPVQSVVVGSDLARNGINFSWFAFEFVRLPDFGAIELVRGRALDDDFVPLFGDRAKGAVGVNNFKGIERGVHHLAT